MSITTALVPSSPTTRYKLGPQIHATAKPVTPTPPVPGETPSPAVATPLPDAQITVTPIQDAVNHTFPTTFDAPPSGGHLMPIALHIVAIPATDPNYAAAPTATVLQWAGSPYPKASLPVDPNTLGPYHLPIPIDVEGLAQIILEFAN